MLAILLVSCARQAPAGKPARTSEVEAPPAVATIWPPGLNVMGDGYPKPGAACRRLGESAATADYLDDSAILIGCPGASDDEPAATLTKASGGQIVGTVRNITLISIPLGDANVGMRAGPTNQISGSEKQ